MRSKGDALEVRTPPHTDDSSTDSGASPRSRLSAPQLRYVIYLHSQLLGGRDRPSNIPASSGHHPPLPQSNSGPATLAVAGFVLLNWPHLPMTSTGVTLAIRKAPPIAEASWLLRRPHPHGAPSLILSRPRRRIPDDASSQNLWRRRQGVVGHQRLKSHWPKLVARARRHAGSCRSLSKRPSRVPRKRKQLATACGMTSLA